MLSSFLSSRKGARARCDSSIASDIGSVQQTTKVGTAASAASVAWLQRGASFTKSRASPYYSTLPATGFLSASPPAREGTSFFTLGTRRLNVLRMGGHQTAYSYMPTTTINKSRSFPMPEDNN